VSAPLLLAALAVAVAAPALAVAQSGARAGGPVRASPLETSAPRPQRARGTGAVAYASATRAYLDAGSADGLAPGGAVAFRRAGAPAGRCEVDLVAEHHASCAVRGPRAGDTFAFEAAAEPAAPKLLPPPPSEDELARRAAALEAAPAPAPIAHQVTADRPRRARARRVSVEVGGDAWTVVSGGDRLGTARVDVSTRGAELGAGVTLDLEARAERWIPSANPRFRPEDDTRLHVWRAQLTAPVAAATLSAGRILPVQIPGATIFDGATASLHRGRSELGLFGGVVPEPDTLDPTTDRATGGAFWSLERGGGAGLGLRHDGRLAVVRSPELGTRVEATLGARAFTRAVDLSAEAQLGAGGSAEATGFLDAARVDVTARPGGGVALGAGYRHTGLEWPVIPEPALFPGTGDAADGFLSFDAWRFLRIGATAGLSRDADTRLDRQWVGPELGLPRLFGSGGGLALGYLEERGWLDGRSAYLHAAFRTHAGFRVAGRLSYGHEAGFGTDRHEAGLSASASAPLGRHLAWRAGLLARVPVAQTASDVPVGLVATASLVASY